MPNYDYHCKDCGYQEEIFQKMSDTPLSTCPKCKKSAFERRPGGGTGLMFKGTGFYETDYKQPSNKCCPCDKKSCDS